MVRMQGLNTIDHGEIEKRKERTRRTWKYQKVDHIPIGFFLDDFSCYSLKELCQNGELQYKMNCNNIDRLLRLVPDDYIPVARVWPGYMTLATLFGIEVHWSDDPNQAPGIKNHIIHEITDVHQLKMPDPRNDGLMPFNLRWLRYHKENLPDDVYLTGIDLGGPLNSAKDLFDTNLLYTAFYDTPDEYHYFLKLVTDLQIRCYTEIIHAVGDINRFSSIDFDPLWAPEGRKGFVSDDVCATISPDIFKSFSIRYNNSIFKRWRGGRIHNCGPHPSIDFYLPQTPEINGLNCSFRYTKDDIPNIKKALKGRGIVEFMFDNGETADEIIHGFELIANSLSPDVVGIPLIWLNETWTDSDITDIFFDMKKISEKYADSMNWIDS
jgi:hypothetical protein